jgi:phage terminase Nu1 subunit (DNA packaging protein)
LNAIQLDDRATQAGLAELIGISKQAVQKHAKKLAFKRGGTYREWLQVYCDHLRKEAAGRAGEDQENLTKQRIKESEQKTLGMQIDNLERVGQLVPADLVRQVFNEFFNGVPPLILGAQDKILDAIESKYSIDLDDELVARALRSAADGVAGLARQLGADLRDGSD